MRRPSPATIIIIFGIVLRSALALVNLDANDPHLKVSQWLIEHQWQTPAIDDCHQCYHPRLYHTAVALVASGLDLTPRQQILLGNLFAVAAAAIWLSIVARALSLLKVRRTTACATLAFAAFAPGFVTIQSQATPDSFVILFGAAAAFSLWRYFSAHRLASGLTFVGATVLAACTKASGWVVFGAGVVVLLLNAAWFSRGDRSQRVRSLQLLALVLVVFATTVPFVSPYRENIARSGSPLVLPKREPRPAPAAFFEKTVPPRPGVESIFSGFFTFRLGEMLEKPYIDGSFSSGIEHRSSFWSQVYGRMYTARFDQWPAQWRSLDPVTLGLTRAGLVVGLFPCALLILGTGLLLRNSWRTAREPGSGGRADWVFLVFFAALSAMLVKLVLDGRQFSWMKPIYMLPGAMGLLLAYARGVEAMINRLPRLTVWWLLAAVVVSCADLMWLVLQIA